jgi:hypothetical protein
MNYPGRSVVLVFIVTAHTLVQVRRQYRTCAAANCLNIRCHSIEPRMDDGLFYGPELEELPPRIPYGSNL